jgi:hypothetical protein
MGLVYSNSMGKGDFGLGLALVLTSVSGLAIAEVITLVDLLLSPADVEANAFDAQVAAAVGVLTEFRKTLSGEKRDQVSEVITLVGALSKTMSEEEKKEVARESVQKLALALGVASLATSVGIRSRHAGAFTSATLGLGVLSAGATGWASFMSSDDKDAILNAIDEALTAVRKAQSMM